MKLLFDNDGQTEMLDIEAAGICVSRWDYKIGALHVDDNGERFSLRSADQLRREINAILVECDRLARENPFSPSPSPLFKLKFEHGEKLWVEAESLVMARVLAATVPETKGKDENRSKAL